MSCFQCQADLINFKLSECDLHMWHFVCSIVDSLLYLLILLDKDEVCVNTYPLMLTIKGCQRNLLTHSPKGWEAIFS